MYQESDIFTKNIHLLKATIRTYPDLVTTRRHNTYPLFHAITNRYPRNIIKCLLDHGANPNLEISPPWSPILMVAIDRNWIVLRECIQHRGEITKAIEGLYTRAPAKERRWFMALTTHRKQFAQVVPELISRAGASYHTPPLEVKPGIIIPGRQGYQDAEAAYLEGRAGAGGHSV